MNNPTCIDPDCSRGANARGLCTLHYNRAYRSGTLEAVALPSRKPKGGKVTDVDMAAGTCTCPIHGEAVRVRVRVRPSGLVQYSCRVCNRGKRGPRKPSKSQGAKRRRSGGGYVWTTYGIPVEEFELRLQAQGGVCLLCQKPMDRPMIDHSHEHGHVRGILCLKCNAGLGFFGDNPEVMMRAAKYVRRYLRADAA